MDRCRCGNPLPSVQDDETPYEFCSEKCRKEASNLNAFNRLLDEREYQEGFNKNRYRYYCDPYGIEYRWTTHKQDDNKFHASIVKVKIVRGWGKEIIKKRKFFAKRKSAKAWCLKHCIKARDHQNQVIAAREKRKAEREAAKPKLTPEQKAIQHANQKIDHYQKLQKKIQTKIKSLVTRSKTYQKRIRYHQKRISDLTKGSDIHKIISEGARD